MHRKILFAVLLLLALLAGFCAAASATEYVDGPDLVANGPAISMHIADNGSTYTFMRHRFTLTEPSRVQITLTERSEYISGYVRDLSTSVNTGLGYTDLNGLYTSLFNPGAYDVVVTVQEGGDYKIQLKTIPLGANCDIEPNDTKEQAIPIELGDAVKGVACGTLDMDVYKFSLAAPTHVLLECPKQDFPEGLNVILDNSSALTFAQYTLKKNERPHHWALNAGTYYVTVIGHGSYQFQMRAFREVQSLSISPSSVQMAWEDRIRLQLSLTPANTDDFVRSWTTASHDVIDLFWDDWINMTFVDLGTRGVGTETLTVTMDSGKQATAKVTVLPPPVGGILLPTTLKLTRGFRYSGQDFVTHLPSDAKPPELVWRSASPEVLSASADGSLSAVSKGYATLTATVKGTGITASSYVCVGDNVYQRTPAQLPRYDNDEYDEPFIFSGAKKLYYKGNRLYLEIYLLNESTVKISKSGSLYLEIYDFAVSGATPIYRKKISWDPGTLKNHKYKVYKTSLPVKQFAGRDLGFGQLDAAIVGKFKQSKALSGRPVPMDMLSATRLVALPRLMK